MVQNFNEESAGKLSKPPRLMMKFTVGDKYDSERELMVYQMPLHKIIRTNAPGTCQFYVLPDVDNDTKSSLRSLLNVSDLNLLLGNVSAENPVLDTTQPGKREYDLTGDLLDLKEGDRTLWEIAYLGNEYLLTFKKDSSDKQPVERYWTVDQLVNHIRNYKPGTQLVAAPVVQNGAVPSADKT